MLLRLLSWLPVVPSFSSVLMEILQSDASPLDVSIVLSMGTSDILRGVLSIYPFLFFQRLESSENELPRAQILSYPRLERRLEQGFSSFTVLLEVLEECA